MDIKVIATDLDGTLLYRRALISKKNLVALNKFINQGGIVCFLTGRCFISAKKIADRFETKTGNKIQYISCLKGAILFDNVNNLFLYKNEINKDISTKIFNIIRKNDCVFGAYLASDLETSNRMVIYGANKLIKFFHWLKIFKNYEIINQWNNNDVTYKINISGIKISPSGLLHKKRLNKANNEIRAALLDQIDLSLTSKYMYEITRKNSNKGEAIKYISQLLNISTNNFATFGDSENDIDMFKNSGLAIAIGTKSKALIHNATHVIFGPQKNAVAKGINNYIFDKKI